MIDLRNPSAAPIWWRVRLRSDLALERAYAGELPSTAFVLTRLYFDARATGAADLGVEPDQTIVEESACL